MIIGITGAAYSGKDTIGGIICTVLPSKRYAFADNVKNAVHAAMPFINFHHYDKEDIIPDIGKSRRELYQTLGTEWGRNLVHPDVWVMGLEKESKENSTAGLCTVVTDIRFDNEAKAIHDLQGVIVEVTSTRESKLKGIAGHISETPISPKYVDFSIANNGTIDELQLEVYKLIDHIIGVGYV